ncbi:MAG: carbohydrate porin [Qipengyuania sp.]|nr:carbohydrate porin [Qipengyuania sp.]
MSVLSAALIYAEPARAGQIVSIEATYTGEIWSNLHGGLRRGSVYLDDLDLAATVDAEKIGWENTTIAVSARYNNRYTFSEPIVGDLQTVSNIDTDGSLRLYEVWIERDFGRAAIKAGLIDLNSEFDVNTPGSLFINSSHGIGPDFSQVGETGPSIFPLTGLGVVARADLDPNITLRSGLFEGTPGNPDRPRRMSFNLDADEGALLVGEISRRLGERGRVVLGAWHHTGGRVEPINADRTESASTGAYLHVEGPIGTLGDIVIDGFVRVGFAEADVHQIARYTGSGFTFTGPMLGGEEREERIGIAIAVASNGDTFRRAQDALGKSVDRREVALELIPSPIDRHACAQWRNPMDMMRHG